MQLDPRAAACPGKEESGEANDNAARLNHRGKCLLAARRLTSVEYEVLSKKVRRRQAASEDEKWAIDVYEYCEAWGIKRIDKAFLLSNGTRPGSAEIALLMRVLHSTVLSPPSQVNLIPCMICIEVSQCNSQQHDGVARIPQHVAGVV